jgi:hypothetical protein
LSFGLTGPHQGGASSGGRVAVADQPNLLLYAVACA